MEHFGEYKILGEPEKYEKAQNWQTAIGLQQVDGLTTSAYLIKTAKANIEGDISIDEVKTILDSYYKELPTHALEQKNEEADKVSARIVELLNEKTFSLSPTEYISIHKRLFEGIYEFAGKIRDYNITKKEWILNGDTVYYASASNLQETLEYAFSIEKNYSYKGLSQRQIIDHLVNFISNLWQIHILGEGNTRTTAVFLIKYLRKLGYKTVNNQLFAENSFYFRNALVRANYENLTNGISKTNEYLVMFFENLLLGGTNSLKSRDLHIAKLNTGTVNDTVKHANDTVIDTVNDTVNDHVLELINLNNKIKTKVIAEKLGISIPTVKRRIKALKEAGSIERVGSDKNGYWRVL